MHAPRKGTPMHDDLRAVWLLLLAGAGIVLGKLLASDERIMLRLAAGRIILGSATSLVAGMLLLQIPDISPLALLGTGSALGIAGDRKSTRLNSSHHSISYAVFCLKKKKRK